MDPTGLNRVFTLSLKTSLINFYLLYSWAGVAVQSKFKKVQELEDLVKEKAKQAGSNKGGFLSMFGLGKPKKEKKGKEKVEEESGVMDGSQPATPTEEVGESKASTIKKEELEVSEADLESVMTWVNTFLEQKESEEEAAVLISPEERKLLVLFSLNIFFKRG
jgi:hypothetical protein